VVLSHKTKEDAERFSFIGHNPVKEKKPPGYHKKYGAQAVGMSVLKMRLCAFL